jgi:hypothetical protein
MFAIKTNFFYPLWTPIWKNHKLFGPKFEYLYPDLDYHQEDDMRSVPE